MMEPDTIHYFPPHISSIEEFKQIAKVYDKYLTMVWKDLDQIRANQHFDEMDETECAWWESVLQIKITGEESLEDRRRNIKGIWVSGLPYTEKKFREVLDAMVGNQYYALTIDRTKKTLRVDLMLETIMKADYIYNLMRAMAPASVQVTVAIVFNRHRTLHQYTNAELAKYTNHQLRTSTDFQRDFNTYQNLATFRHSDLKSYMQVALMTQRL